LPGEKPEMITTAPLPDQIGRPVCFGTLDNGEVVKALTLQAHGLWLRLLTYGATLQGLKLSGASHSLVVGLDTLDAYCSEKAYLGANVGRFANRISCGSAKIHGHRYQFDKNCLGRHTLHGGSDGTGLRNWRLLEAGRNFASFGDELPDGHMGFPGRLRVGLTYRIVAKGMLELEYVATCDRSTLCAFAHHSYFNLNGSGPVSDHELKIAAKSCLPVDEELIPLGAPVPVKDTMFDFRSFARLGERSPARGLDHNFCLSGKQVPLRPVAWLRSRKTATELTISTTEPGLQVYDGLALSRVVSQQGPLAASENSGIALEPQCWPDAPNQRGFPDAVLEPGQVYRQVTRYQFCRNRSPSPHRHHI